MSDETSNNQEAEVAGESLPQEATTEAPDAAVDTPGEHQVPVSALQKEREKAARKIEQLEAQLQSVAAAEEERKLAEMSELERAQNQAREAQAKAEALQAQLVQEQRKQVALAAASSAGYRDPSDALRYVDLAGEELSEEDIRDSVARVLEERDYLKASEPKGPAQTTATGDGDKSKTQEDGASSMSNVLGDAMKFVGR